MLHYDRIELSKGLDLTKSNNSEECMLCHCWFLNDRFKLEDSVSNGCLDLTILPFNINHIAIITVEGVASHCVIHNISKSEAINLLENSMLDDCRYI